MARRPTTTYGTPANTVFGTAGGLDAPPTFGPPPLWPSWQAPILAYDNPYMAVRRLHRGIRLARAGARTVAGAPALLAAPLAALAGTAAVCAGGAALLRVLEAARLGSALGIVAGAFLVLAVLAAAGFLWNLARATVAAHCIAGLRGPPPPLSRSAFCALRRARSVASFSATNLVWGSLMRVLDGPGLLGMLGRVLTRRLGMSWSAMSVLAVPVVVSEQGNVRRGIERAAAYVRSSFGPGLSASGQFGTVASVALLLAMPMAAMLFALTASITLTAGFLVALLAGLSAARSLCAAVFSASMYAYVTTGVASSGLTADDLAAGFRPRRTVSTARAGITASAGSFGTWRSSR